MPFCISILISVRRIVKIAVRFLHTKTALCDRKDTQSRFAVNAARSIVCVGTESLSKATSKPSAFQCRTQHCVCWDRSVHERLRGAVSVLMPHAALCVLGRYGGAIFCGDFSVSMPHAALCVLGPNDLSKTRYPETKFQCRTQHCVCWDIERG